MLALWESNIAAALDAPTLQAGLQWDHSDLGRLIARLESQNGLPEEQVMLKEFENFKRKGTAGREQRARGCAQVDILQGRTEAILPFMEAFTAGGAMAAMTEQGKTFDSASVLQMVAALRPQLREAARQGVLLECLYAFRELDETKFEEWLVFLRSDAGGRYARGVTTALRDALLARSAIFASTLVDVMRQIRDRPQAYLGGSLAA